MSQFLPLTRDDIAPLVALSDATGFFKPLELEALDEVLTVGPRLTADLGPILARRAFRGVVYERPFDGLAFGAEGVLFVGDPKAAAVYAIGTGDTASSKVVPVNIDNIGAKLAGMLGVKEADVQINDLAVNPASNKVYLSVSRGKGPAALPVILAIGNGGEIKEVALASVPHAKAELSKPVAEGAKRMEAITGLKVVKDKLFVAGLSNEEFASTLRKIALATGGAYVPAGTGTLDLESIYRSHFAGLTRGQLDAPHPIQTAALGAQLKLYAYQLFTTYLLPVHILGFLLLAAMLLSACGHAPERMVAPDLAGPADDQYLHRALRCCQATPSRPAVRVLNSTCSSRFLIRHCPSTRTTSSTWPQRRR